MMGGAPKKRITKPSIVVLHLNGTIVDGVKASPGSMVSGPTVKAIQELTNDDMVKGVVARINSPGGSATASEAIRRALEELAGTKPVVISMGSVAASGGYWISCFGSPIYAEPVTITGSIGVLALKLSFGPLLNRVGIRIQTIGLDESAAAMSPEREWTDDEIAMIQSLIDDVYDRFLKLVSSSRGLEVSEIEPLAGGRVWSGTQAQAHGLVDRLGGVDDALAAVARSSGLEEGYEVVHRPRPINIFEALQLFGNPEASLMKSLDPGVLGLLERAGFNVSGYLHLALEGLSSDRPRVLVLSPADLIVL
jgi:protease-4